MAEYIDVGPKLETDADRRLKRWEAMREGCRSRQKYPTGDWSLYYCNMAGGIGCAYDVCPGRYWAEGWR